MSPQEILTTVVTRISLLIRVQITLNHTRCVFFLTTISRITYERNLRQEKLTIEITDSDLKVYALYYANELLVRVRLSFQKRLPELAQHACTSNTKKCVWEKSNDDKPGFYLFLPQHQRQRKSSFRPQAEKVIVQHIDASSVIINQQRQISHSYCEISSNCGKTTVMTCIVVDKSTVHDKPHSIC